jgi:transcription antitermination factor NusG
MRLIENDRGSEDLGLPCLWHALYTRHQHEKTVTRVLSNKGHEVFLPLYSVAHRWRDRNKQLWMPLFPCYVFLRGGLDRRLQILTTPGVFTIVGWASRPAVIPQVEIDAVRKVVESSLRVEPHPFLQCGDRVRVKSGPLQGLEGILIRKMNQFRLVISMKMLGRSAAVEVDVCCLERVNSSQALAASHHLPWSVPANVSVDS